MIQKLTPEQRDWLINLIYQEHFCYVEAGEHADLETECVEFEDVVHILEQCTEDKEG